MLARVTQNNLSAIEVFETRCEARALLWSFSALDLHEATDVLQADAEAGGLVAEIGPDAVQTIMAAAFRPYRLEEIDDEEEDDLDLVDDVDDDEYFGLTRSFAAACRAADSARRPEPRPRPRPVLAQSTIDALGYVIQQANPLLLRGWLGKRSPAERAEVSLMLRKLAS